MADQAAQEDAVLNMATQPTQPPQQVSRLKKLTRRAWTKLFGPKKTKPAPPAHLAPIYSTTKMTDAVDPSHTRPLPSDISNEHTVADEDQVATHSLANRRSRLTPPRLRLGSDIAEDESLHPPTVESIKIACRPQLLPQASSFYDENIGLRSSIDDSSPPTFRKPAVWTSPYKVDEGVYGDPDFPNSVIAGRDGHETHSANMLGPIFSRCPDSDALSPSTDDSGKEASFSHLLDATRMRRKTFRSSQLATRVFGIAELCEAILLAAYNGHVLPQSEPARWLFTVKRVNKSVAATIAGSPRLKQLMWLTRSDGDSGRDWDLETQPLGWLLKSAGVWEEITCTGRREGRRSTGFTADYTIRLQIRDYRVQLLLSLLKTVEALGAQCSQTSWRSMQTCKWHIAPTIRFEFQYISGTAYDTIIPLRRHDRNHWLMDDRKTLGDVYDVLKQMLQTYDDYRAMIDDVETIRAREDKQREDRLQAALRRICGNQGD
ncbi:hypothetical protein AC578_3294 [Pseudocercospora eumusae]|uniref:Uncharacterized protein n=1 Tax=Pseudocercospora eumusae TaxID=321146 RepID=A0A139HCM6_9PEZI|nr:hypothetical protein AC578_3294 [Pseudocercospora eumusae]